MTQSGTNSNTPVTTKALHTILVVDDDVGNLEFFARLLKRGEYHILTAESGEAALKLIQRVRPDLILLDIMMPGLDGFETCAALKSNPKTKDIPVIFLTALADIAHKVKGFDVGGVDYITKPPSLQEILARVKTHLTIDNLQQDLKAQNRRLEEENLKRRRVQDALRESRERYRLLAENSTDIIARQTPAGTYRYVSPACKFVLGYKIEEMVGRQEIEFVHPEDAPYVAEIFENIKQGRAIPKLTYRARCKDERYIWLETTRRVVWDDKTDTPVEITSVSRNVTDRKRAEEALQQAHDKLEQRVAERTAELVQLNAAFARFVPHEFLNYLGKKSISDVQLGDQVQRKMTIFCSDLRSFTSLSEKMTPQENFNYLNTYLRRVSPIIREYGGFVDKYIGDAVMALFPEQAEDALHAAITIQKVLKTLNIELKRDGLPAVNTGTSIHTGSLMLGTIGEEERMESTVISDSVNTAFRLEGLTKIYGASIVMSQDSLFSLAKPTKYHFRFLDRVRVKGKEKAISVFEIFENDPTETVQIKLETLPLFEKGLLFYHAEEFTEAVDYFERVLAVNPGDKAAQLYLKRANHFVQFGPPPDWEGITALTEK